MAGAGREEAVRMEEAVDPGVRGGTNTVGFVFDEHPDIRIRRAATQTGVLISMQAPTGVALSEFLQEALELFAGGPEVALV
jgi:hypothetical protein